MVRSLLAKFSPKYEARLLSICINNPEDKPNIGEWNKKSVRFLVKELGKDLRLVDELEKAISQQSPNTKCILVSKTHLPDKHKAHRHALPQLIFARLWRWPDLKSQHQLKAIHTCVSSEESQPRVETSNDSQKVCINPYHYERVVPQPIEPILVPVQRIPPDLSTSFEDSDQAGETLARPGPIRYQHQFQPSTEQGINPTMVNESVQPDSILQYSQGPQQAQYYQQGQYDLPGLSEYQGAPPQQYVHSQGSCSYQPQQIDTYTVSQEQQQYPPQPSEQYQHSQAASQYQNQYPQQGSAIQASLGSAGPTQQQPSSPAQPPQQLAGNVTEIARPFRFKQNKFAQVARARQQSTVNRYQAPHQDSQSYVAAPYAYGSQSATQPPVTYQPYQQTGITTDQQGDPAQLQHDPGFATDESLQFAQHSPSYAQQQMYPANQPPAQFTNQDPAGPSSYRVNPGGSTSANQPGYFNPNYGVGDAGRDQPMDQAPIIDMQEVPYTEGAYWCSITYHEYDQRIGEKYHSNSRIVYVDGYTQPMCSDRFCIGGISNINRNSHTEWVRRRIGRGVKLNYVDGEVYVEDLSEGSIFVSHPLEAEESDDKVLDHVSKLTYGNSAKVFSTQQFSRLLSVAVTQGFEAVYKLTNCCVIRVSYVKGWGKNYKRQSIYNTPCWVEIQLNGPLQWIDKVLRQMRPPTGCGSTS